MKDTLSLSTTFEFKRQSLSSAGQFAGYASTFGGPPDRQGHVIARGAFSKSLADHRAAGTMPALLWAHDPAEPIGRIVELNEDAGGLAIIGQLALGVPRADAARVLMQADALSMSIGFRTQPGGSRYDKDGIHVLTGIDLWEISLVSIPANPAAKVTAVKSIADIRAFEKELRDVLGFSQRDARRLASGGWPAFTKSKATPDASEIAALFRQSAERLKG